MSFTIKVDLAAVNSMLDGVADECEAAARPAAQAMAQVFYDDVKANVSRIKRRTGNLAASIYQAYSKDQSTPTQPVYHISWNAKRAPHGHLVEYGHLQRYEITYDKVTKRFTTHKDRPLPQPKHVAARPFLRPAVAKAAQAEEAGIKRYIQELQQRGVLNA